MPSFIIDIPRLFFGFGRVNRQQRRNRIVYFSFKPLPPSLPSCARLFAPWQTHVLFWQTFFFFFPILRRDFNFFGSAHPFGGSILLQHPPPPPVSSWKETVFSQLFFVGRSSRLLRRVVTCFFVFHRPPPYCIFPSRENSDPSVVVERDYYPPPRCEVREPG